MPIKATRALLAAALEGTLDRAPMRKDPWFGVDLPKQVENVDAGLLSPRDTWNDKQAYDAQARRLAELFIKNFTRFESTVDRAVTSAGPVLQAK
jgi:phosphoenolpyruvate carboxykinase (ATP)